MEIPIFPTIICCSLVQIRDSELWLLRWVLVDAGHVRSLIWFLLDSSFALIAAAAGVPTWSWDRGLENVLKIV